MVAQEKPKQSLLWSVPSGGIELYETFEECCIREIKEETGYNVNIIKQISEIKGITYGVNVHVKYFAVELIGGTKTFHDPDQLILDIDWKSKNEIKTLEMLFEDERKLLLTYIENKNF